MLNNWRIYRVVSLWEVKLQAVRQEVYIMMRKEMSISHIIHNAQLSIFFGYHLMEDVNQLALVVIRIQ